MLCMRDMSTGCQNKESFDYRDIELMLRLPTGLAGRVLSTASNRKSFIQILLHNKLTSLPVDKQVLALQFLLQHSDLLLTDDQPVDRLLLEFIDSSEISSGCAISSPLIIALLKKWQAHIVMMISRAPPIVETTQDRISPLSLLFSAKFRRDMCQDLDTSSHVLHSLLATDYSFPLSLRSRNSAIAKALQNLEPSAADRTLCTPADATKSGNNNDKSGNNTPTIYNSHSLGCHNYHVPPSNEYPQHQPMSPLGKRKELKDDDNISVDPDLQTSKRRNIEPNRGEKENCSEEVVMRVQKDSLSQDAQEVLVDSADTQNRGECQHEGIFASTTVKKELVAFIEDYNQSVGVMRQKKTQRLGAGSVTSKQLAKNLCQQLDRACTLAYAPLSEYIKKNTRDGSCDGGSGCHSLLADAILFYSLAVKALGILESDCVTEEVFLELVIVFMSPEHLEKLEESPGVGAGSYRDSTMSTVSASAAFSLHLFLSCVVQGRIRAQLGGENSGSASRRLIKALETCWQKMPGETVTLVLAPCLLPPCSVGSSLSAQEASGSLQNVAKRVIQQGLPPPYINQLFVSVFSLPYDLGAERVISEITASLANSNGDDVIYRGGVIISSPWSRKEAGQKGGSNMGIVGMLMRAVSSAVHACAMTQLVEEVTCLNELFSSGASTSRLVIKQPSLNMDCLKFISSSMLIPLLAKKTLTSSSVHPLLLRLDEVTSLQPSLAEYPPIANLMHSLVQANRVSGNLLLAECLEETKSVLLRILQSSKRSDLARQALADVTKQLIQ